jgi:hypothetical protein
MFSNNIDFHKKNPLTDKKKIRLGRVKGLMTLNRSDHFVSGVFFLVI